MIRIIEQDNILYHFTTTIKAMMIIDDMQIINIRKKVISFTRSYNLKNVWTNIEDMKSKSFVRLSFDKGILSNRYKIVPFSNPKFDRDEREEIIMQPKVSIKNSILRVDIHENIFHPNTDEELENAKWRNSLIESCKRMNIPVFLIKTFMPYNRQEGRKID